MFNEADAGELGKAGLLHDIGKAALPPKILQKPGELTAARMAAVCDVHDAVTSRRAYKEAAQPSHVLADMFDAAGQFDPSVLGAFIRSVGIYPIGSLVRLKSGRLAVVVEQDETDLTRLLVRAFYATAERKRLQATNVALAVDDSDEILSREQPERWGFREWDGAWSQLLRSGGARGGSRQSATT